MQDEGAKGKKEDARRQRMMQDEDIETAGKEWERCADKPAKRSILLLYRQTIRSTDSTGIH